MKDYRVKLNAKIKRTSVVESFCFSCDEKIDFTCGQFMQIIFDEANLQNKELNKYLSFSSSPENNYYEFTKRLSASVFSGRLRQLEAGDEFLIKAPMGNCVFKPEYKKIGFLIGGIGITPVISIIEYVAAKKLNNDILLLYSNRTDEDIAFKKELDLWQRENKNIKVIYLVTDCQPKDNTCIQGRINAPIVKDKVYQLQERVLFVFGPPNMVEAMNNLCLELGCSKDNIKTESFIGY